MIDPTDLTEVEIPRLRAAIARDAQGLSEGYADLARAMRDGTSLPVFAEADALARKAVQIGELHARLNGLLWVVAAT